MQLIMFGMGTTLSLGDFVHEFKKPLKLLVGTALAYVIMPLAALAIVRFRQFPDAVAAGIVLIGVCPGGAASNVMTYLAKGNVALSVSLTTLATFVSPVVTPVLMRALAGQLIAVDTLGMMISILNMILVPLAAGLICNRILYGDIAWLRRQRNLVVLGLAASVAGLSLASIMLYIVIVSAHSRDTLLSTGPALFVAAIAHNLAGFALGYGSAKALHLNDRDARAFAIEMGLKNTGLGVGLAYDVLKSEAAALASVIQSTWMNVSGSTLANFWRQRPPREA